MIEEKDKTYSIKEVIDLLQQVKDRVSSNTPSCEKINIVIYNLKRFNSLMFTQDECGLIERALRELKRNDVSEYTRKDCTELISKVYVMHELYATHNAEIEPLTLEELEFVREELTKSLHFNEIYNDNEKSLNKDKEKVIQERERAINLISVVKKLQFYNIDQVEE